MVVKNVEKLIVSVDKNDETTGVMGIENRKIKMLFVSAEKKRQYHRQSFVYLRKKKVWNVFDKLIVIFCVGWC